MFLELDEQKIYLGSQRTVAASEGLQGWLHRVQESPEGKQNESGLQCLELLSSRMRH